MKKPSVVALAILAAAAAIAPAKAETASVDEMVRMAQRTASLFECASYASFAQDRSEQERLFTAGIEQGRRFIAAVQANQEQWPQVYQRAPLWLSFSLVGPSPDFMLGLFWGTVTEHVGGIVWERLPGGGANPNGPNEEARIVNARNGYQQKNCRLL